ncbi:MAG: hypothetical protein MK364_00690 [Pirellulales bacterium]|nr:hypothetical protein [Pirellulales bacterium]
MVRHHCSSIGIFCFALLLDLTEPLQSQEIGFVESFALAPDRQVALRQLTPGTEDYYYYHCLQLQHLEQFDRVEQLLADWSRRHRNSSRIQEILHRQALLTYPENPQETLRYLRQQLQVNLSHQRERVGAEPNLATLLDPALLTRAQWTQRALQRHQNLAGFEDQALGALIADPLNATRRRHLLARLQRPDHPGLVDLVVEDLNHPTSKGFGSLELHKHLLRSQLEACLRQKSELLNQAGFVEAYVRKLWPNPDTDWRRDAVQREAYLDRLWAFVSRLDPVHNSLRAHVAYHRLVVDRARGVYDKEQFRQYVRLPRNVNYINRDFLKAGNRARHAANLKQEFRPLTLLPPIGNDEPLVRSYLQSLLLEAPDYQEYEAYLDDAYLKRVFAEVKIVHGVGATEQWVSLLSPGHYEQLKQRVDLDFAFTNKQRFAGREPVQVDMYVKNVEKLLVKIYEVNTQSYYREHGKEIDTDFNLDGLVAHHQQQYEYKDPALRRVVRHFDFPQLDQPGVYVVDFIGNGRSSRVVVRKGRLRYVMRNSTAGHVFTVLDENHQPVQDARLWMAGREYKPREDGHIVMPYGQRAGRIPIVLSHGNLASLAQLQHRQEEYQLRAGIYVDRESLVSGQNAQVLVRPGLFLNGVPVTLSILEDPELVITSQDHDGISTTQTVRPFALFEHRESVHEFRVPPRLAELQFTLRCRLKNLSRNREEDLSVDTLFTVNGISTTDKTEDLHLIQATAGYWMELRGRNGEGLSQRPVRLEIKHTDFRDPLTVTLKTDPQGQIELGSLDKIERIQGEGPEGTVRQWVLQGSADRRHQSIHGAAGETIELIDQVVAGLPLQPPRRTDYSLLEIRGDTYVSDRFEALKRVAGALRIEGLPAGDYDLLLKRTGQRIQLRVSEGVRRADYLLADQRYLELRGQRPLRIAALEVGEQEVRIQLGEVTRFARVHVFATRYQPAYSAFDHLARVYDAEPLRRRLSSLETRYVQGRMIGDEYRYILDRRQARKFPGNTLRRPSLLLNPWPIGQSKTRRQRARQGDDFAAAGDAAAESEAKDEAQPQSGRPEAEFSNLDFLSQGTVVLANQVPNEQGVVTIARDRLQGKQQLHVLAIDPRGTSYRSVALPPRPAPQLADLRLTRGLDPLQNFTQTRHVTKLAPGEALEIADSAQAKLESYDSLTKVFQLWEELSAPADLQFVLTWPALDKEQKRARYAKYACHELNFFLFHKDRPFFDTVIRPFLENKRDKQFVDRWLLGRDLGGDLRPWYFSQLNVLERVLLGRALPEQRASLALDLRQRLALVVTDPDHLDYLFDAAIKSNDLNTEGLALGLGGMGGAGGFGGGMGGGGAPGGGGGFFGGPPTAPKPGNANGKPELQAKEKRASNRSRRKAAPGAAAAPPESRAADKMAAGKAGEVANGARAAGRFFQQDRRGRQVRQLFESMDKTQEWVENHYYQLPISKQAADRIEVNRFWVDYAEHDPQQPFVSTHLAEVGESLSERLFALAVLDLPFVAAEQKLALADGKMTLSANSPAVVFHKEIQPAAAPDKVTRLLVSQNFYRQGDRYRYEDDVQQQRLDKFVTEEFLVGVVYGCQVVVTNPTSAPQKLNLLLQIPVGAIPVLRGDYTRTVSMALGPFHTDTVEYAFYFPAAGKFSHFPVHVSRDGQLLATAAPFQFHVVPSLTRQDTESWAYLSQEAEPAQLLAYLSQANLHRIPLEQMAWRMRDRDFFLQVVELLSARHVYDSTLWSYALLHNVPSAIRSFLAHQEDFIKVCGAALESPLIRVNPVARKIYEQRDYRPLVNARRHVLGGRRQIQNQKLHAQYHRLLKVLSYRQTLNDDDRMAVVYYLLLQDRIAEALDLFAAVDPANLQTQVQYDYFTSYLAFFSADPQAAREMADRYVDFPVASWRNAFAAIRSQLEEFESGRVQLVDGEDRGQRQTERAASQPVLDFAVEARQIRLNYRNLAEVRVNYYEMDIELMFSTTPFVRTYDESLSYIRPNHTQSVELPRDRSTWELELPPQLHNRNLLIEIEGDGQRQTQTYFAHSLDVRLFENYGQLQVLHQGEKRPLSTVYVKVYARLKNGQVRFYKDGYTDLRGRFDYVSLNMNDLQQVEKFSVLLLSPEQGAVVREVVPPRRPTTPVQP